MTSRSKIKVLTAKAAALFSLGTGTAFGQNGSLKLITLDPGHFHAALVQRSMYAGCSPQAYVYSPGGPELRVHLALIERYNTRADDPTHWNEIVYTGPDYLERMLKERPGNVVVIAGNNLRKAAYMEASVAAGLHVLADKPMVITGGDFQRLKKTFARAKKNRVLLYDIMTERYAVTNILQKELAQLPEVFGKLETGAQDNPAVVKESVHHFFKYVSGAPLTRPVWYFDTDQEGEGIVDVTTHLVDLVQWECFPEVVLNYGKDIRMLSARHWPTTLTPSQFKLVTGAESYPSFLQKDVRDSLLDVYANGEMNYTIKGVYARVSVTWDFMEPPGTGDLHYSLMRGTRASLVIRQGKEQQYKPVLYIEPAGTDDAGVYEQALYRNMRGIEQQYPGVKLRRVDKGWEVEVPERYRTGHESQFAEVMKKYLQYLREGRLPEWEVQGMLAKYYNTTQALEMARRR